MAKKYIDAEAAVERLREICAPYEDGREVKEEAIEIIADFKPADVQEVRHGKWIADGSMDDIYYSYYKCSICGRSISRGHGSRKSLIEAFPYCTCGAKMDGGNDNA